MDNGSELISKQVDRWTYENQVELVFSRPGKPTDNPYIESFQGSFRDECLNAYWFQSLEDVKEKIEIWREEYNTFSPHSYQAPRSVEPKCVLSEVENYFNIRFNFDKIAYFIGKQRHKKKTNKRIGTLQIQKLNENKS